MHMTQINKSCHIDLANSKNIASQPICKLIVDHNSD
jgi:hypothetical protein